MSLILPKSPDFDWAGDGQRIVCPCCEHTKPHTERFRHHMELLQELRKWWGNSITITSGHRCSAHNKKIGGAAKSQHVLSKSPGVDDFATDQVVSLPSPQFDQLAGKGRDEQYENWFFAHLALAEQAKAIGFTGIGVYRGDKDETPSCHFDLRDAPFAVWGEAEAVALLGDD